LLLYPPATPLDALLAGIPLLFMYPYAGILAAPIGLLLV
jgi:hypothetical protein